MKKAPKTRFVPFQEEWDSKRFADAFSVLPNNTLSRAELSEEAGTVKNVHYGDVLIKYGEYLDAGKTDIPFIASEDLAERWKSAALQDGDVVMADTAEDTTAGKCSEIENVRSDTIVSGLHTIPLHPMSKFSEGYLGYYMNSDAFHDQLIPLMQGTKVTSISKTYLADTELCFPHDSAEQAQIAQLLYSLDQMITSQQRKCEKLIALKAACLDKMFPKTGNKVPELRFAGFSGDWEQRKLSDLAVFNPKAELPDIFEYVDLESVVGTEMLSHRTESKRTAPSRAQRLAQTGDLFYQTVRPYQKNNYLFEKPDKHYVFSTGYAQMRPVVDGRFLLCLVQNDGFVKVVLDNCTGTSYPAINSNDLAEIEVYSPRNPQEQKQIGDYFKGLDSLITLHQRKMEKLRQFKQAMMHNMFV